MAHRCLRAQDVSQWIHKESADISALYKKIPKPASGNKEEKLTAATDPQLKKMRSTLRECHRCARRAAKLSSRLRRPQPSAARLPRGPGRRHGVWVCGACGCVRRMLCRACPKLLANVPSDVMLLTCAAEASR